MTGQPRFKGLRGSAAVILAVLAFGLGGQAAYAQVGISMGPSEALEPPKQAAPPVTNHPADPGNSRVPVPAQAPSGSHQGHGYLRHSARSKYHSAIQSKDMRQFAEQIAAYHVVIL